jgi:hypothetical protein
MIRIAHLPRLVTETVPTAIRTFPSVAMKKAW